MTPKEERAIRAYHKQQKEAAAIAAYQADQREVMVDKIAREAGGATSRGVAAALGFPADLVRMIYEGLPNLPRGESGNLPPGITVTGQQPPITLPPWMSGSQNILNALDMAGTPPRRRPGGLV